VRCDVSRMSQYRHVAQAEIKRAISALKSFRRPGKPESLFDAPQRGGRSAIRLNAAGARQYA